MTLFERIKETGKKRGWNVKQVAVKAGIGENAIYRWKDSQPTADKLVAVADVLGVTVDYLLGTDNTPEWATQKDVTDLKQYLEDDAAQNSLNFGGDALTEEENEKLRIAITQIFWEKLKDHKRQQGK
jgi:transcriptional regulator with XRE-family HTH domain